MLILGIFDTGENPEEIGEAVEEEPDDFGDGFAGFVEGEDGAFGAAGDGTGEVEAGAGEGSFGTRGGPVGEADAACFVGFCGFDEPVEIGLGEGLIVFFRVAGCVFGEAGEFAHEADEAVLKGVDERNERGIGGGGAGEAEGGIEFVDGTKGFDAEGCFGDAAVEEEVGVSRVAAAGDDAHGVQSNDEFRAVHSGAWQACWAGDEVGEAG